MSNGLFPFKRVMCKDNFSKEKPETRVSHNCGKTLTSFVFIFFAMDQMRGNLS